MIIPYELISDILTREEWEGHEAVCGKRSNFVGGMEVVGRWRFDWSPPKPWTKAEIDAYAPRWKRREDLEWLKALNQANLEQLNISHNVVPQGGGQVRPKRIKKEQACQYIWGQVNERDLGW